jgi:hypothetical protein
VAGYADGFGGPYGVDKSDHARVSNEHRLPHASSGITARARLSPRLRAYGCATRAAGRRGLAGARLRPPLRFSRGALGQPTRWWGAAWRG